MQPRQLPDGLLEVRRAGQEKADLFIVEITTYPDRRLAEQIRDDVTLVLHDRRVLPEVLVLVLHSKGNLQAAREVEQISRGGWTQLRLGWRVVELWTLPAEELLATALPGLMPWVPLAHFNGPPEELLHKCRAVIAKAAAEEHDNLLAVTQVLAGLRYRDPRLLAILGGREAMIESPVLQQLLAEQPQKIILGILEDRFGPVPAELTSAVTALLDNERLQQLARFAARCPDVAAFREQLTTLAADNEGQG